MKKKYKCFVISPIGNEGTEIYEEYKDLYELIIRPALEIYPIDVKRGDHFVSEDKIDDSVIRNIQEADICICDISEPNPNVYYELGRRDETGKPVVLLKKKGTAQSPVDIATRRYIEYEWEGRYGIRDAQDHIRSMVGPMIEQGFEDRGKGATLRDIADTISRLERKIDRLSTENRGGSRASVDIPFSGNNTDPVSKFKYALLERNLSMAEEAMQQLQYRMDELAFYDQVVEQVAALGSVKAGEMLIEKAEKFFDSDMSFKKKIEYLGCMISYAYRVDKEMSILELVEKICDSLEIHASSEEPEDVIQIYNQQNRLYHGIFGSTRDVSWLDKAIIALKKAIAIYGTSYLYNNLAMCYYAYADEKKEFEYYQLAEEAIDMCLELDTTEDAEHLKLACKIYIIVKSPKFDDVFERLAKTNPMEARLLAEELKSYI